MKSGPLAVIAIRKWTQENRNQGDWPPHTGNSHTVKIQLNLSLLAAEHQGRCGDGNYSGVQAGPAMSIALGFTMAPDPGYKLVQGTCPQSRTAER